MHACIYSQIIFDKGVKTIQRGKRWSFQQRVLGKWISTCKGMKLDPYLLSTLKFKLYNLLENTGRKPTDIGFGNDLQKVTTKAQAKKNILDCIKLKYFLQQRTLSRVKWQLIRWRKYFQVT